MDNQPETGLSRGRKIAVRMAERRLRPIDVVNGIARKYPGAHVSGGHFSDILYDKVAQPHPKVIVPIMLFLDLEPKQLDITPANDWASWTSYRDIKEHGWPLPLDVAA